MSKDIKYAHSRQDESESSWQTLDNHLQNVANLAKCFADDFGYGDVAYEIGLIHDIGKIDDRFQTRLHGSRESFDHASVGARWVSENVSDDIMGRYYGHLLSYAAAGHHGGMPDGLPGGDIDGESLSERVSDDNRTCTVSFVESYLRVNGLQKPKTFEQLPIESTTNATIRDEKLFATIFAIRMVFSCLVDADFFDTERFMNPERTMARERQAMGYDSMTTLVDRINGKADELSMARTNDALSQARQSVSDDCLASSKLLRGFFSLSVPTGGGKTLSSLRFALNHALAHGMHRVIYAIPFTSIVEQTADVFTSVLGSKNVLEHHSAADVDETHRLACEDWSAPIVVTTNAQLFDSLFSNKPGKCRKLHNIANSVIVLDEAQAIPDKLMRPILAALTVLVHEYGCSVVFCTATQPALETRWPFVTPDVHEIVHDVDGLRRAFSGRTKIIREEKKKSVDELVDAMVSVDSCLTVVNTKRRAADVFHVLCERVGSESSFHLSAAMAPSHRTRVLDVIRQRLIDGLPTYLVSTSLIEAGVDIDFPEVWREISGTDSIMQAAGRCNREQKLGREGIVHVFELDADDRVPGFVRNAADVTRLVLATHFEIDDRFVQAYFRERYAGIERDMEFERLWLPQSKRDLVTNIPFASLAKRFHVVDSPTVPVFVPYGDDGRELWKQLECAAHGPYGTAYMMRRLQRFCVNVYQKQLDELVAAGYIDPKRFDPIMAINVDTVDDVYNDAVGLLRIDEVRRPVLMI